MQFIADYVEASTDATSASVMFANPQKNPDQPSVLSLQRPIEFADSAYYFEINDQSNSGYGGLESVRISRNQLEVRLSPDSVARLGDENFREVLVEFDVDDATYESVLSTLERIFPGFDILEVPK
jgi:hypothetical protein